MGVVRFVVSSVVSVLTAARGAVVNIADAMCERGGSCAVATQAKPSPAPAAAAQQWALIKMEDKAKSHGAVCLDGTPGAFYIRKAPSESVDKKKWMIHLQGGGWCYDKATCYNRAYLDLGGSSAWYFQNKTGAELGADGILSDKCTENPTFCNFNLMMAIYCDGTSFAGNREDVVTYRDSAGKVSNLWFRGRRILEATFDTLFESYGLCNATDVLLGGDSACGLAVFQHTNYVQRRLKECKPCKRSSWWRPAIRFGAAPNSGFFLFHGNAEGTMVWQSQMYNVYYLSNWTITDNRCMDQYPQQLQWLCLFPENAYKFIEAPIFVLNSALDLYQTANILSAEPITFFPDGEGDHIGFSSAYNASAVPGWRNCTDNAAHISDCTRGQIYDMNAYMDYFNQIITSFPTFRKPGNGAFIYGCFNHDAEMSSLDYTSYQVDGVPMRDALSSWWGSWRSKGKGKHTYVEGGRYMYPASVTDANPTCNYWCDGLDPIFCPAGRALEMWQSSGMTDP
mmetsp:Transcript_32436/g.103052  ORF Transcript_32436/g.103052 Transcript_32436/m.103052 type:complete len:509 (+) Transcript_32436:71-1597(+)